MITAFFDFGVLGLLAAVFDGLVVFYLGAAAFFTPPAFLDGSGRGSLAFFIPANFNFKTAAILAPKTAF